MYKFLTICISIIISIVFAFLYFFLTLENNFKNNFKNMKTAKFYEKYFNSIEHIRYKDRFRFEEKNQELIFNYLKKNQLKKNKIILFQGDSWMNHINKYQSSQKIIKENLSQFPNIINAGTTSYSPSLMYKQLKILEEDFKIFPTVMVIYIDQTDMGDELCRYKHLIQFDKKGKLINVAGEKYPLYQGVFNLHEKISLSIIELSNTSKFLKTNQIINYKAKKSFIKIKKKFLNFFNDEKLKKCEWRIIEGYKKSLSKQDKLYLIDLFKKYFNFLDTRDYIKSVFIVTHPHKIQLTTKDQPIDVSEIVSVSIQNQDKFHHINFKKILKNEEIYENFHDIWKEDHVHLKEKNYNLFLKRLIKSVNEKIY